MGLTRRLRPRVAARFPARGVALFGTLSLFGALSLIGAGCSGDDTGVGSGVPDGAGGTIDVATLPAVATTVPGAAPVDTAPPASAAPASSTTVVAVTAPTTTAASAATTSTRPVVSSTSSTSAPPATLPPPPCVLDLVVEQTQTRYEGITPADLACEGDLAAWIGRPDDELRDGFFAVARWTGSSWELLNLGTAQVCTDAGVPAELFDELGCFD